MEIGQRVQLVALEEEHLERGQQRQVGRDGGELVVREEEPLQLRAVDARGDALQVIAAEVEALEPARALGEKPPQRAAAVGAHLVRGEVEHGEMLRRARAVAEADAEGGDESHLLPPTRPDRCVRWDDQSMQDLHTHTSAARPRRCDEIHEADGCDRARMAGEGCTRASRTTPATGAPLQAR